MGLRPVLGSPEYWRMESMMRMISAMLLGLLAIALLPGCAGMMGSERRDTNAEVILTSFGSVNGELAPCG
jgi:hypothetical protein